VVELRHAVRYPIRASVVFAWQGPAGWLNGEGITRDISGRGAFVRTPTCPPIDVTVEMEIFLPPIEPRGKSMTVATSGRVIRVEHFAENEALSGFAVLGQGFGVVYVGSKQN
jgi:hypothetical protein